MLEHNVPGFIARMPDMAELFAAQQPEIDRLDTGAETMLAGFFLSSLTPAAAALWERQLGFSPAEDWDMERRRERLRARLTVRAPLTPAALARAITRVGGVACTVTEYPEEARFTISFTDLMGVPVHIRDIQEEVDRIRPLHMAAEYAYLYATLALFAPYTLAELVGETLEQMTSGQLPE